MEAISSNHVGVDAQAMDALAYLEHAAPSVHARIMQQFPELERAEFGARSTWFDTEAMGVDVECGSWLVEAIEDTGLVLWEEGEPWAVYPEGL